MGLSRYWDTQTVTSNLFRIFAWLFLRVIPSPRLVPFLPILYALYLGFWITGLFKDGVSEENAAVEVKVETTEVAVANGNVLVEGETKIAVVTPSKPVPHGTLSTLFLSLPTPSFTLRGIALLVNSLLLASVYDFITQPTRNPADSLIFTRIGAVDPDGAKIAVRWPNIEGGTVQVLWRQTTGASSLEVPWQSGPLISLNNASDWVGVGRIGGLWPSTTYEYRLAYPNATELPYPETPIPFRTFPDPRLTTGNHFKFIVSSCMQPNFPYLPFKGDRIRGLDLLSDYLGHIVPPTTPAPATTNAYTPVEEQSPITPDVAASEAVASEASNVLDALVTAEALKTDVLTTAVPPTAIPQASVVPAEFMLFLGDFIYAEVPRYGGDDVDMYRRLYRRTYASPSFRQVYERLPIITAIDDHEIYNNFVGKSNTSTPPYPNAFSAYQSYNGQTNYDPKVKEENYYEFRYGDVAYFVLDTRLHRSGVGVEEGKKITMLGDKQLSALHEWLEMVNTTTTFKFIVSSVPFTSLWTHDAYDTWAGYLEERDALLSAMATVPNIFVLSGDRHEFAAIEFLGGKIVEFSTSPLSMFYIPIVRTLKKESKRLAEKYVEKVDIDENGKEVVRTELEWVPEERVIKYLPLGNYKWSAIEIDTTDRQKPTLKIDVVINGRTEWQHTIIGQPITLKGSSAIGTQITRGLKGAFERIRFAPTKWF